MSKEHQVLPRILRYRSAPGYLGMCRTEFDKAVRPLVKEFPIGARGVGFDRYELDEWADTYIAEHAVDKTPGRMLSSGSSVIRAEGKRSEQSGMDLEPALELVRRKR